MGLPYISTFHATLPEDDSGAFRIGGLRSFLQSELSGDTAGASADLEVESDGTDSYGYALITCERPHPRMPQQQLQLEVRICEERELRNQWYPVERLNPCEGATKREIWIKGKM